MSDIKQYCKILVLDDDEDILLAASMLLRKHYSTVHIQKDPKKLLNLVSTENYDVVLLDMNFTQDITSGREGFYWLKRLLEIAPKTVVVMITAYGDVEMAVQAIKEGAMDFVLKPWQNEKLISTISAALQLRTSKLELDTLKTKQRQLIQDSDAGFRNFIGSSGVMKQVFSTINKVAPTEANILITGENGTGKELVARALHRQSKRSGNVFIAVDMGSLNENVFESELFGHTKGSFTDAKEDRQGRFEVASGGTLFLDEIGNLSLTMQAKLLTVLQNREIVRVGSNKPIPVDIRLVCATNMNLPEMVRKQQFRQDLLYRINTVEIKLSPLRDRREDVPLLTEHFMNMYSKKYGKYFSSVSATTLQQMMEYGWPGNVRELQHAIERAVILCDGKELELNEFHTNGYTHETAVNGVDTFDLDTLEKNTVVKALQKHSGNITQAARELGLTRTSLYRRIEKYGI